MTFEVLWHSPALPLAGEGWGDGCSLSRFVGEGWGEGQQKAPHAAGLFANA